MGGKRKAPKRLVRKLGAGLRVAQSILIMLLKKARKMCFNAKANYFYNVLYEKKSFHD